MYDLEEVYRWFIRRRRLVSALVAGYSPAVRPRILDVGCGTGGTLVAVREQGQTIGCDQSPDALRLCRQRRLRNLVASRAESLAFRSGSVDVVLSCDVLEHIARDDLALAEMCRVLAPGGILIATAPAYPGLWSSHDEILGYLRRYTRRALAPIREGRGSGDSQAHLRRGLDPPRHRRGALAGEAASPIAPLGRHGTDPAAPRTEPVAGMEP